jgi:Ion channel
MFRTSAWRDRRERYGLLLGAIMAAFAVQGISTPGPWEQMFVTALLAATLLLALWAADARPKVIRGGMVVALAVVAASIGEAAAGTVDGSAVRLANLLLVVLAPPAIVVGVMRSLRARSRVTVEAVFGVLSLYILLGMFFSLVYGAIYEFSGTFFTNDLPATAARSLYFSFTTLTTIGYGDVTASTNLGHTLAVSEGLLGQIYLVTIVSLIVSNLGRGRPERQAP